MYNVINTALYIAVSYASTTQSAICQDGIENFGKIDKKTKLFIVTYVAFRDEKVYNEVTIKYRKVYPFSNRRVQAGRIRSQQTILMKDLQRSFRCLRIRHKGGPLAVDPDDTSRRTLIPGGYEWDQGRKEGHLWQT